MALAFQGLPPLMAAATPNIVKNPDLPPSCGLDVSLVLDDSGSISSDEAKDIRSAADAFAKALIGTPSTLKVVVFSDRAQGVNAAGNLTSTLNDVVFRDPAKYTAPTSGSGSGSTNWDDALEVVRRSPGKGGDVVVFLTDGDPTRRNEVTPNGHDGNLAGDGSSVSQANVDQAITEANSLKTAPGASHMFGVGIGLSGSNSKTRLSQVTGPDEMTIDGNGDPDMPFGTADYVITPNTTQLKAIVQAFVKENCAPSLNVTKYLQPANGGPAVRADETDPWTFSANVSPEPSSWQRPSTATGASATQTTDDSGGVSFKWENDPVDGTASVALTETAQSGWVYNGARCYRNNLDGSTPDKFLDSVGTNAVGQSKDIAQQLGALSVGPEQSVSCEVYNRQVQTSTIQVTKKVNPSNLGAKFDFTLKSGTSSIGTVTGLGHGQHGSFNAVDPGKYSVVETPAAGFTLASATCDDLNTTQTTEKASPTDLMVGEGQRWNCTFTNDADPGTITVVKKASGANGTFGFTSNVPSLGDFSLTTTGNASGGTATTSGAAAVGTYNIAESDASPWDLTSASCTGQQNPKSVTVAPGQDVTCTFTNEAPAPSITVAKQAVTSTVGEPGGPADFKVTVTNTSVEPVTIKTITDAIGGGAAVNLGVVAAPITATTCNGLVGKSLAINEAATCTFTATVTGNGGTTVNDVVEVTAKDADGNTAKDSDDANVRITDEAPVISVTKTPSVSSLPEPGGSVTYTVSITNKGAEPVVVDSITDVVETGPSVDVTVVAGSITATTCAPIIGTTVAVGATTSCTFTLNHVVNAGDFPDGTIDDTVTVDAHDDDSKTSASADAEVAVIDVKPVIEITKTAAPTSVAETAPGQTRNVTYTVAIQNKTAEAVTIDSIADSVGGGPAFPALGTCAALVGTTLAPQSGINCTFTLGVAGNAGDTVTDVVTVGASDDDGNDTTDSDEAEVTITDLASSITVTKTANPASVPEPGGPVTYTVGITNTSEADTVKIGSIVDAVDGNPAAAVDGTCDDLIGTDLAPGGKTSCTFTMAVAGNAGANVADTVTVSATDDDGKPVSNSADETVAITDVASSITVVKTASVESLAENGGPVTYTVKVTNTSAADKVTIDSIVDSVDGGPAFAAGGDCPSFIDHELNIGASVTCSFTLTVTGNAGDAIHDTVTVEGTDDDGQPVTGQGSEVVDITDVASDISVTKTASVSSVPEPGGSVTYTVGITNNSPADVVVIDTIRDSVNGGKSFDASGTCPALIGTSLAPGASTSCSFDQEAVGNAGDRTTDKVKVTGTDDDGDPVSGSASEVVDITDVLPTGKATKKADSPTVSEPGGPATFHVRVTNKSTVEAATVTSISDEVDGVPVDVTKVGGMVTATDCGVGAVLAPGAHYDCSFTLAITGANAGDQISDTIRFTLKDDEGNSTHPSDTETVEVTDVLPAISVVKDNGDATVGAPGGEVTFQVTVTNDSPDESVTVTSLTDTIEGVGGAFSITEVTDPVLATDCVVGTVLAAGESYNCSFTLAVLSDEAAQQADTVDAVAVDDEGNEATGGDGAVTTITANADLSVDKTLIGDLTFGEAGTYELAVTNEGPSTAVGVEAIDQLPAGVLATSASGDGWACDVTETLVTCQRPSLAPGETSMITVEVFVDDSAAKEVTNVVDVTTDTEDPDPTNNHDEEETVIIEVEDVKTPTTTTPRAQTPGPAPVGSGPTPGPTTLTRTGSDVGGTVATGFMLVLIGGGVLLLRRRRLGGA
ncbi:MAG: hypothetical protein ABI239_04135 [Aquihabitans sp.]